MTNTTTALDAKTQLDDDGMFTTWEFKGIEIKPLSYARKWQISKLVNMKDATPYDLAMMIFLFVCKQSEIERGLRNNAFIDKKFFQWMNKVKLEFSDFDGNAGEMISEVMAHSNKNQAEPVESDDPNLIADPTGNE
jgi:hypothetical protein